MRRCSVSRACRSVSLSHFAGPFFQRFRVCRRCIACVHPRLTRQMTTGTSLIRMRIISGRRAPPRSFSSIRRDSSLARCVFSPTSDRPRKRRRSASCRLLIFRRCVCPCDARCPMRVFAPGPWANRSNYGQFSWTLDKWRLKVSRGCELRLRRMTRAWMGELDDTIYECQ